jgi:hypothetical protein
MIDNGGRQGREANDGVKAPLDKGCVAVLILAFLVILAALMFRGCRG